MPYNAQFTPIPTLLPPPKSAQWKDGFLDWNIARFEADSRGMPAGEHVCSQTDNSIAHDQGYYLKISEGCDNRCTYCAIPLIRGKHRSRTIEDIVNEAKDMESRNTKRSIQSKRKHTEKLCLVLRVVPQKELVH